MRYAYGVTSALLLGGATISLITGQPAGAQVAQNDDARITAVTPRAGAPASFADLTEQLAPAVVNISTRQRVEVQSSNPFAGTPFEGMFGDRGGDQPTTREGQSLGSGFLISADGYVVTNNHVVTPQGNGTVEEITVTMPDGSEYEAKMVGKDAESDLAVLKIDRAEPFPFVKFGDSAQARAGDWVVAIGNPFALSGTVTAGIISALHRGTGGTYDKFIQTDASINQGNSGGPMFDMRGNVIGINSQILSPSGGNVGIGFAIPSEQAEPIVRTLMKGQTVKRGYLGVQISPLGEDLAESLGLAKNSGEFIQGVEPGKGADKAGIKAGDVIVSVNGQEVNPDQNLSSIVANQPIGSKVPIVLIRNGQRMTVTAVVGERPPEDELNSFAQSQDDEDFSQQQQQTPGKAAEQSLGIAAIPLTPGIIRQLGIPTDTRGIVITGVDGSTDAGAKGLRRGDVIISANNRPVTSQAELDAQVKAVAGQGRNAILLQVLRRGQPPIFLPVRMRDK